MATILIGRKLSSASDSVTVVQGAPGGTSWLTRDMNRLVPSEFDHVDITARNLNDDPTTVVYKTGGAAGSVVATLTLTYDVGDNLKTVTRV